MAGEVLASSDVDLDTVKTVATIAVAVGAVGLGNKFLKPYVRVPTMHEAIRERGGNASTYKWGKRKGMYKCMPRGPHLQIPFSHDVTPIYLGDRTTDLPKALVDRPGGSQFNIEASVIWRVMSSNVQRRHWLRPWRMQFRNRQENDYPARYQLNAQDAEEQLQIISRASLREAVEEAPEEHFRSNKYLSEVVANACNPRFKRYGVEILSIEMAESSEGAPDRLGRYLAGNTPSDPASTVVAATAAGALDGTVTRLELVKEIPTSQDPA